MAAHSEGGNKTAVCLLALPLIKAIRYHQTTPLPKGGSERGFLSDSFCLSVDQPRPYGWVLPRRESDPNATPEKPLIALFRFATPLALAA